MNWAFDPRTGDLIREGGFFRVERNSGPHVYCQLTHEHGAWVGDPDAGSKIREIMRRAGDGPDGQEEVVLEIERALKVLAAAGDLDGIEVRAERNGAGRVDVAITYRDRKSGQVVNRYLEG